MSQIPKIFESEYRFCLILWETEPITTTELVRLCKQRLNWQRTTTYTVIKRLSERGVVKCENSLVTALISKEQVQAFEIDALVKTRFDGSLPAFVAAFTQHQRLTRVQIDELQKMIDRYREEDDK